MYFLIFAYYVVVPLLLFYFFCRYCDISFQHQHCFCYVFCHILLCQIEQNTNHHFYWLIFEILLLSVYGSFLLKGMFLKTFLIATLLHSIYSICNGFMQLILFWLLSNYQLIPVWQYGDSIHILFTLLLTVGLFFLFLKYFGKNMAVNGMDLYFLIMPVFFISIVERIISNYIYGNTIVLNEKLGIVFPVVNHATILLLQLFALICLFIFLVAYQNIKKSICAEQTIQLLKQQYHLQEIYMQEAQIRYEKTRSFRHDIKNHFIVLSELLKNNHVQKAHQYLYRLEEMSQNLSFEVQTGNVVINALLNSKFSVAKQKNILIDCELKVADTIEEIDWCIVLCNALDNAIAESDKLAKEKYICVKGERKENIYMLSIKNKCREEIKQIPKWGIGLNNINAVCKKYGGTMSIQLQNGIYCLNVLFIIPQQ